MSTVLCVMIMYRCLVFSYVYPKFFGFGEEVVIRGAWIDLWAFAHVSFGVFVAKVVQKWRPSADLCHQLSLCCLLLLGWEVIEIHQEAGYTFRSFAPFHGGLEHPFDRLIVDPVMGVLGVQWYYKNPRIFWPVTVAGIAWWLINIYLGAADGVERIIWSWF